MKRQAFLRVAIGLLVVGAVLTRTIRPNRLPVPRHAAAPQDEIRTRVATAYGHLPLNFEANNGQTDSQVEFLARGAGHAVFLTRSEAVLVLTSPHSVARHIARQTALPTELVLRMGLLDANPRPRAVGVQQLSGSANYFIGNDPKQWHKNVPMYAEVQFRDVYPGIGLRYSGDQHHLEYDFVLRPGADPSRILLHWEGVDSLEVTADGDLVLHTAAGVLHQPKPDIYYVLDGARRTVAGGYVRKGARQAGLAVAPSGGPLVITCTLPFRLLPPKAATTASAGAFDSIHVSQPLMR